MERISSFISNSEAQGIRHFIVKVILFLLPLLVLVGLINFLVDPSHVYSDGKFEQGIAEILVSGKNVTHYGNCDERLIQKFSIEMRRFVPEMIVIGSSRYLQVGTNVYPGVNIINNSVSGAVFGDHLGILFNYDKKGSLPKTVLFGLDPWLLNPNTTAAWGSLKEDALSMLGKVGVRSWDFKPPMSNLMRWVNLFDLTYFQAALRILFKKNGAVVATDEEISDDASLLKDGRLSYGRAYRSMSREEVRLMVKERLLRRPDQKTNQFVIPSIKNAEILGKVVRYLQDKHVEVVFLLLPDHPEIYKSFVGSPKNKIIIDLENYYRDFAKKYHLKVIGCWDPSRYGLTEFDYYDEGHLTKEAVEKIFKYGL